MPTATETFAHAPSTTVPTGGTTAPAPGTSESWTVTSSATFPAASTGVTQFKVVDPAANTEVMLVTNVSGVTWTVTRGVDGTTPVTHSTGFTAANVVSAATMTSLVENTFGAYLIEVGEVAIVPPKRMLMMYPKMVIDGYLVLDGRAWSL